MKVVFVSGKYRGKDWIEIEANIQKAKNASITLWKQNYAVICPHMNTAHFDGLCDDSIWLEGDLEILRRCDVVYFLSNWRESAGACMEHDEALHTGKEIIYEA